ncbi:MAG: hypothetical protein OSJ72_12835 [Lachnospiraceae bacterium]|nr:hypothetical protein [Lachnospiraceae bacterium]
MDLADLFEAAEALELYDFMAGIIRSFLDRTDVSIDALYAEAAEAEKDICWDWRLNGNEDSLLDIDIRDKHDVELLDALQWADQLACRAREDFLWEEGVLAPGLRCMDGLNSEENRKKTNILLLPRYQCIWEGESREENHRIDINSLLQNTFYIEIMDGRVNEKYTVLAHFLNPCFYDICSKEETTPFLSLAVSPVTNRVKIDDKNCRKYEETDGSIPQKWFAIDGLYDEQTESAVTQSVKAAVARANENHDQILVFPEMLGTKTMKQDVMAFLQSLQKKYLQFIIFPSIWESGRDHRGKNTAYFIDSSGNEWFGQEKLRRFPLKDEQGRIYWEDIEEGKEIHLVYGRRYGCMAIAICRSELDQNIRELLVKMLNAKLILCPSWSSGSSYEFETSFLTGAEMACNVAWCNTCSAMKNRNQKENDCGDKRQDEQVVGIITVFGKNSKRSKLSLDECRFTNGGCGNQCKGGCIFSKRIYGIVPRENKEEEYNDQNDAGSEKAYLDDNRKEKGVAASGTG